MVAASKTAVILLFSIGFSVFYLLGSNILSSRAVLVEPTAATNQVTAVMAAHESLNPAIVNTTQNLF